MHEWVSLPLWQYLILLLIYLLSLNPRQHHFIFWICPINQTVSNFFLAEEVLTYLSLLLTNFFFLFKTKKKKGHCLSTIVNNFWKYDWSRKTKKTIRVTARQSSSMNFAVVWHYIVLHFMCHKLKRYYYLNK